MNAAASLSVALASPARHRSSALTSRVSGRLPRTHAASAPHFAFSQKSLHWSLHVPLPHSLIQFQ